MAAILVTSPRLASGRVTPGPGGFGEYIVSAKKFFRFMTTLLNELLGKNEKCVFYFR